MARFRWSATNILAGLIALAYVLAALLWNGEATSYALGFIPARFSGFVPDWPAAPAILTPLTSAFVHASLLHLGFNLLIFLWCGNAVERVLGKAGLIVLFVVGAYVAAFAQWAADPQEFVTMIGASGAVSAVIGAYSLSFGRAKALTKSPRLNRWLNALWLMAAWVALQLMTGYLAGAQGTMLATPAHIGGFIAGLLLQRPLLLLRYRKA